MKERDREERQRGRGEREALREQLRLFREGHVELVAASKQVEDLARTLAQATYTERRTTRINELRMLEQDLRADGRQAEADQVKQQKYVLLFNPGAPLDDGGRAGGARMPTSAGTGMRGDGGASSAGTPTSGGTATGTGATVGARGGGGGGAEEESESEREECLNGGEGFGGDGSEYGAGGNFGGGGQGADSGRQARNAPRCKAHNVECTIHVGSNVSVELALPVRRTAM